MRIAFIEPAIAHVEPLGIAYLIQILINDGHTVKYFESPRKDFFKRLKKFNPDVLAYSVTTGKHRLCRTLNASLRKKINAISLFGGPHCTFYPEFIESSNLIDGICRGEGEFAISELLKKMENGKKYTKTNNWWLRVDGKIYKNPVRNKVNDLDTLPFPNRDVIYVENKGLSQTPIKRIIASRGCPFNCSYCFNRPYNALYAGKGKVNSHRSPRNLIEELKIIQKKYPFTFLKIVDDTFGFNMDYGEFAELYKTEIGLPFMCNVRPNLLNEDKIKNLKKAGCVAVTMAVESGNEFIRNKILNRNLSEEIMSKSIITLKRNGLKVYTQNIIGNPGETFEMVLETFKFSAKHQVDFAECFLLTPFYGTDIYKYCVENKYIEDGINIDNMSQSIQLGSCIKFNSAREKKYMINFQKFFSFGVKHPQMLPFIKILIKLPPNKLFVLFNKLYDAWRTSRIIKVKFNIVNLFYVVKMNLDHIFSYFIKTDHNSKF
ncbi:MAG: radical SAM protein [Nanoarchaeota archaeon]|nr:radical SAM protein [Nanoarchaeota archaeon]